MTDGPSNRARESDIYDKLEQAWALFNQGQLDIAESLCREVLLRDPQAPAALHLLGLIRFRMQRYAEARDLLEFAVHHAPQSAALHNNLGNALCACGDWTGALSSYRSALMLAPEMLQAHNNLGLVKQRLGDGRGALAAFCTALDLAPEFPEARINRGISLRKLGDWADAITWLRAGLEQRPTDAVALHNLSLALKHAGQLDDAQRAASRSVELAPALAEAHWNLSELLLGQGNGAAAEAACQRAIALDPTVADYYRTLQDIYGALQKPGKAEQVREEAARHATRELATADRLQPPHDVGATEPGLLRQFFASPGDTAAVVALARFYEGSGDNKAAVTAYRRVLAERPGDTLLRTYFGLALTATGQFDEALEELEQALRQDDTNWLTHYALGQLRLEQSDPARARESLERALEIERGVAALHCALGTALVSLGEIARARQRFEHALAIDPTLWEAWRHLASIHKGPPPDGQRARLEAALRAGGQPPAATAEGQFALAKMLDDSGEYEAAFIAYKRANAAATPAFAYDPDEQSDWVARTLEVFDARRMQRGLPEASSSSQPIFIIGMPRSGSTLVEQILCSHPEVAAAGELDGFFDRFRIQTQADPTPRLYLEAMDELGTELVTTITTLYLERIRELAGKHASRITDKTLINYVHLGLIGLLFPNARIIHCRRDVMDCSLSIYFHYMTYVGFSADLYAIGHCYRLYQTLMKHWRRVLGDRIYDVRYEELVSDQEAVTRRLLDACELEWDARCLQYHRNERAVMTSSNWQVRQPLYTSAVGRWRHYEPYLDELKAGLGEYAPAG